MSTYAVIRDAIVKKQQVSFDYEGHERIACPHAIGRKNGREQVLVFQFGGSSSRGLPLAGQWRCIPISGITNLTAQNGQWFSGTGHSATQTCVDQVDVEVAY